MKICTWCGNKLIKRDTETRWQYNKREFCDKVCAYAKTLELMGDVKCGNCGKEFKPKSVRALNCDDCRPVVQKKRLADWRKAEKIKSKRRDSPRARTPDYEKRRKTEEDRQNREAANQTSWLCRPLRR